MFKNLKTQLCGDQEDCELVSDVPDCGNISTSGETYDKTFYNIIKRDVSQQQRVQRPRNRPTVQVKMYTRISKKMGLWDKTITRSENIRRIKNELKNVHQNEEMQMKLSQLGLDIHHIKIDEFIRCQSGSVAKKLVCGNLCGTKQNN